MRRACSGRSLQGFQIRLYLLPDQMEFAGRDPFLAENASADGDRACAVFEIILHIFRRDSGTGQQFDLLKRAFDLPEIIRPEAVRGKDLDHRGAGLPRGIDIRRDERPGKNRDLVFGAVSDHGFDKHRTDNEGGAGIERDLKILHVQHRSRADHQFLSITPRSLPDKPGRALGVHREFDGLKPACGNRIQQRLKGVLGNAAQNT